MPKSRLFDEATQVRMPVDAAEDEYALKLRVCGSMGVSHDQLPKHIVKRNRAFLSGLDTSPVTVLSMGNMVSRLVMPLQGKSQCARVSLSSWMHE